MFNTRSHQKTFLMAAVLVALVQLGHGQVGKSIECCKLVSTKEITEEVIGLRVDRYAQLPCLPAVIFYTKDTKDSYYCAAINAPWIRQKVIDAAKALTTKLPSKRSLRPIIASSAPSSAPPSSSSESPSSSSFSPRLRPTFH